MANLFISLVFGCKGSVSTAMAEVGCGISGRVLDEKGTPIPFAAVSALQVGLKLMPALDRLAAFSLLPRAASVLDLCCGTGHLAAAMCRRGLRVTGLDGSEDMLSYARRNAPGAQFVLADARRFGFATTFAAVLSTGDSMNHMLSADDLAATFLCVHKALDRGGRFVFDMNMAEAFERQWHKSSTVTGVDHLLYLRGRYDRNVKLGTTEATLFSKEREWTRLDLRMFQRCYALNEVKKLLLEAGFSMACAQPARSFGIRGRLAAGRTFFAARKV
ncbi:MAG TPA: class I SAM-dependent methyltransferase [Bryobacteraceae bacterium]|nr:class I SAM-dependent methyltransferase [Bryobacteraceae bacterium]